MRFDGEGGWSRALVVAAPTGGVLPYHWAISVGGLPAGITMTPDGVISGTPSANGYFAFSVQVFDADSTAGLPRTISIVPRLAASLVPACATECTVELGCVAVCGTFGQVSGGLAPFSYTRTSGALPAGTTLNGLSLNGTFVGLPGRLSFTVQVTDGYGVTAAVTPTFNLLTHILLANGSCPKALRTGGCSATLPYSGGTGRSPTLGVASASGKLCIAGVAPICNTTASPPPRFSATVGAGVLDILVPSPASQKYFSYTGTVVLILTDQSPCGSGSNCSATASVQIDI